MGKRPKNRLISVPKAVPESMSYLPSLFDTNRSDTMDLLAKAILAGLEIIVAVVIAVIKEDDDG